VDGNRPKVEATTSSSLRASRRALGIPWESSPKYSLDLKSRRGFSTRPDLPEPDLVNVGGLARSGLEFAAFGTGQREGESYDSAVSSPAEASRSARSLRAIMRRLRSVSRLIMSGSSVCFGDDARFAYPWTSTAVLRTGAIQVIRRSCVVPYGSTLTGCWPTLWCSPSATPGL
jgi:hypothetical protein